MEATARIRVLLVDDHVMVRQGLRAAIQAYPNIEVVGEADDGDSGVVRAAELQPAVVIMDIAMPKMDGITATRLIKTQHPQIVVLGLSVDPKDFQVSAMRRAGAFDVLKKEQGINDLYESIQRAVAVV